MFPIQDISKLESAFPSTVKGFMPDYKDIPQEFKHGHTKWNTVMNQMFFMGGKITKMVPKPGVDGEKALAHIYYCLSSWEPKHEHKEAGVAFLMNEWFDELEFEPNQPKRSL